VTRSDLLASGAAWHPGCRALLGTAALAGLAGAPSLPFAVVVALFLGAYGALVAGRDRVRLRWWGWVGVDLVVLAAAGWLLAHSGLLAVAVLLPALAAAVAGTELGRDRVLAVAAITTATLALTQATGPGPDPSWRTVVAVGAAGVLAVWAGLAGSAVREDAEARVAERRSLEDLKEQVVTTVSHELRTPLTIIQGLTSTLMSRWDALPETRRLDLIDALGVNVASLDASVLHFLDAGRLSKDGWDVRPTLVEVEPLVDVVLAKLDPVLAGHEVARRLDAAQVWADPVALGRMLELLLVNACRFSPPAGSIGVKVSGSMADGWEVSVADNGQGISAADLPKIFDRLWRADVQETGVSRGAGLGLAIVKELAERHGGTATATSARGRGSTVRISLPAPLPGTSV